MNYRSLTNETKCFSIPSRWDLSFNDYVTASYDGHERVLSMIKGDDADYVLARKMASARVWQGAGRVTPKMAIQSYGPSADWLPDGMERPAQREGNAERRAIRQAILDSIGRSGESVHVEVRDVKNASFVAASEAWNLRRDANCNWQRDATDPNHAAHVWGSGWSIRLAATEAVKSLDRAYDLQREALARTPVAQRHTYKVTARDKSGVTIRERAVVDVSMAGALNYAVLMWNLDNAHFWAVNRIEEVNPFAAASDHFVPEPNPKLFSGVIGYASPHRDDAEEAAGRESAAREGYGEE